MGCPQKRMRTQRRDVLDSEWDKDQGSDSEYQDSVADHFQNPEMFLSAFRGYDSDKGDAQFSNGSDIDEDI